MKKLMILLVFCHFQVFSQDFITCPTSFVNEHVSYSELGDYDNDGDIDIMVGEESGIYRNDNNAYNLSGITFTDIGKAFDWADFDNDGDLELGIIGIGDQSKVQVNNSYIANSTPFPPAELSALVSFGEVHLEWGQGSDQETADLALTYNIYLRSLTDGSFTMAPASDLNTGQRRIAQMGNVHQMHSYVLKDVAPDRYTWSVQTVDNSFRGSPFADPHTITIPAPPDIIALKNDSLISHNHVSFLWNPSQYATGYHFQLSADSLFNTSIVDANISDTAIEYIVTPNLTIPTYFWRIYAYDDDGNSAWTDTRHFNVPVCDFSAGYHYIDSGFAKLSFINTSTGDFNHSRWDFGDGNSANIPYPGHSGELFRCRQ
jgi:hypothetical protein